MLAAFGTTPASRFLGASRSVHGCIQHKVLVSGYQSIDTQFIVLPLKFEGGLSILVLRNKQLLKKKKKRQSSHFQKFTRLSICSISAL
jgi:hypothetical protein